jgi:aryl-alcohol dehydrogenase-like predicted oxidoreductase
MEDYHMQPKELRRLGRSNIVVSAMGFGCWAIGGPAWRGDTPVGWGVVNDDESVRAVRRAVDMGVNFFDTANVYGAGQSETVLGRALHGLRDEVIIATKFGNGILDAQARQIGGAFARPQEIRSQCEDSLRRLGTETIDLYQFHLGGHDLAEVPQILETLEALVTEGKIRAYGWSTDDPERARAFAAGAHCTAVQFQLNVLDDNPAMVDLCDELDLAGLNRGPLAMGLLTGKFTGEQTLGADDVRGINSPVWMKYFQGGRPSPEWNRRVAAVRDILTSGGRTLAQGALAWLWARSPLMIPIPGFRTEAQVEENVGALRYGPLTAGQMDEIQKILSPDPA